MTRPNSEKFRVRRIEASDEARWRDLWDAYSRFYDREPSEAVTRCTWTRIMNHDAAVHAIVAEQVKGEVIGIANYTIQENTSFVAPSCYLADLIVHADHRGSGAGKLLIDWLVTEMSASRRGGSPYRASIGEYRRGAGTKTRERHHGAEVRWVVPQPRRRFSGRSRIASSIPLGG